MDRHIEDHQPGIEVEMLLIGDVAPENFGPFVENSDVPPLANMLRVSALIGQDITEVANRNDLQRIRATGTDNGVAVDEDYPALGNDQVEPELCREASGLRLCDLQELNAPTTSRVLHAPPAVGVQEVAAEV